MEKRELQRITRTRHLTPQEVAENREIRRKLQEEFPPARRGEKKGPTAIPEAETRK
jgi:hypothetical protein